MICDKKDCLGCCACYNSCPQHCIEMKEDEYGYIYPEIDKNKCTNCGLCHKHCPINNKEHFNTPIDCIAGWSKIERETSTSGGIAAEITKHCIDEGGVVYGAAIDHNTLMVNHVRVDSMEYVEQLKRSKYVHSYIGKCYSKVKTDLENGRKVVFTGTPCQIAGLKNYLHKEYSNLLAVDIVCHGVPSRKFLREYMDFVEKNDNYDEYSFRDNNEYFFTLYKSKKVKRKIYYRESEYILGFLYNLTQRENCFTCKYARDKRVSDITIGDFWGGEKYSVFHNIDKGVSAVLINTPKGLNEIESIKEHIYYEKVHMQDVIDGNTQLQRPTKRDNKRDKFLQLYLKKNFQTAVRRVLIVPWIKYQVKKVVKR